MRPQAQAPWRKTLREGARAEGATGRRRAGRVVHTTQPQVAR